MQDFKGRKFDPMRRMSKIQEIRRKSTMRLKNYDISEEGSSYDSECNETVGSNLSSMIQSTQEVLEENYKTFKNTFDISD